LTSKNSSVATCSPKIVVNLFYDPGGPGIKTFSHSVSASMMYGVKNIRPCFSLHTPLRLFYLLGAQVAIG